MSGVPLKIHKLHTNLALVEYTAINRWGGRKDLHADISVHAGGKGDVGIPAEEGGSMCSMRPDR